MADVDDGAIVRIEGAMVRVTCRRDFTQTERWCIALNDDLSETRNHLWLAANAKVLEVVPQYRTVVNGASVDPVAVR